MLNRRLSKPRFQVATLFAGVVLLLIIFVSAGYFFTLPGNPPTETRDAVFAELDRNRALWQRMQPEHFAYVVDRDCACPDDVDEPYRVEAMPGGTLIAYDGDYRGADGSSPPRPMTIDDLFGLIERATVDAALLQVFYDSEFGYPAVIRIDWDELDRDDEQAIDVRNFAPIQ